MNVIKEMLSNIETTPLQIGRVGENLHTQVRINCITIFQDYPEALVDMAVVPPVGDAYPAIVERDGVVVVWDVLSSDLAYEGRGQIQLTFRDDEEIIKTVIGSTTILPSIEPTGEAPTPIENWIDEANEILDEFGEVTNMTASAETVAAGASAEATVSKVDGHFNINFKIPRGASGNETIDDTAGIGDTDKVWSADKDAKEISALKSAKAPIITESISTPADVQTFTDGADGMLVNTLTVGIEPVQDLHGQSNPYPAGGGKNLLPMTLQNLKNMNTEDSWNGNVYTRRGITYTVNTDGGGDVVSITVNGTATYNASLVIADSMNAILTVGSEYTLTGCPANGSRSTYAVVVGTGPDNSRIWIDEGSGDTKTYTNTYAQTDRKCFVAVFAGNTVSNLTFTPMMRLSSESATFAPYSNICPITGHTGANVSRTGKNLFGGNLLRDGILACISSATDDATNRFVTFASSNTAVGALTDACKLTGKFKPNTVYTFIMTYKKSSVSSTASNMRVVYTDGTSGSIPSLESGTGDTKQTVVFVSNGSKTVKSFEKFNSGGTTYLYYDESGIFEGTLTAQDFATYVGNTYAITFPTPPGTVYGGTLTIHQDGSGKLVVDHGFVDTQSDIWTLNAINEHGIANFKYYKSPLEFDFNADIITSALPRDQVSQADATKPGYAVSGGSTLYVRLYSSEASTVAGFKQWASTNGLQILFKLATPVTYQLTNQQVIELLKGSNNIWADTGKINAVDYPADTKLYIDGKIASLQALILENISNT